MGVHGRAARQLVEGAGQAGADAVHWQVGAGEQEPRQERRRHDRRRDEPGHGRGGQDQDGPGPEGKGGGVCDVAGRDAVHRACQDLQRWVVCMVVLLKKLIFLCRANENKNYSVFFVALQFLTF